MSFIGKQPSVVSLNLTPQAADPADPREGDVFYSNGVPRTEGPWVYVNGSWAQFSTGAAITIVNNITLTPQAADPGSPATGMLFYSDGTARAAGLWAYNGTGWVQITGVRYQEFTHKTRFTVRAASTVNVTLANQVENGDSFGGVTLATNDLVLLKNQSAAAENGVYVVAVSGAPARSTSYDTFTELNGAQIFVSAGTNANNTYWQTAILTSLSDNQTWGTSPPTFSLVVPQDVYEMDVFGCSGGGGGGAGSNPRGGGGGGGPVLTGKVTTTPGETLTIAIGVGGLGGQTTNASGAIGTASTVLRSATKLFHIPGGGYGGGGTQTGGNSVWLAGVSAGTGGGGGASNGPGGAGATGSTAAPVAPYSGAGGGGGASAAILPAAGGATLYNETPGGIVASSGTGGSGGGGGASLGAGGAGGAGGTTFASIGSDGTGYGSGGGGGGGATNPGTGGRAMDGFLRLSWS